MQDHSNIRPVTVFVRRFGHRRRFARRSGSTIALEPQGSVLFDLLRLDVVQLCAQLITSVSGCIQKLFQELLLPRVKLSEF